MPRRKRVRSDSAERGPFEEAIRDSHPDPSHSSSRQNTQGDLANEDPPSLSQLSVEGDSAVQCSVVPVPHTTAFNQHGQAPDPISDADTQMTDCADAFDAKEHVESPGPESGYVTGNDNPDQVDDFEQIIRTQLSSPTCSLNNILDVVTSHNVHAQSSSLDRRPLDDGFIKDQIPQRITKEVKRPPKVRDYNEIPSTAVQTQLPALSNLQDIFEDIARKVAALNDTQEQDTLAQVVSVLGDRKLRVGTMCSGTESPILAMTEFRLACERMGVDCFDFKHEFSCEVEPFKQAYIQRNFKPPILFRDVREFKETGTNDEGQLQEAKATSVYKVRHDIPRDLDLLIAGFSCIDFSNLNTKKKGLEDDGQSGQTFFGILGYVKRFRPRIVILENIQGCPWPQVIQALEDIGYASGYVKVDTRDYYLPQTRSRGYLVAYDIQQDFFLDSPRPLQAGSDLVQRWADLVLGVFKRPASAPFLSFIMEDSNPILMLVKQRLSHDGSLSFDGDREFDWVQCRGRHEGIRLILGLGWGRPQTNWSSNGGCIVRDHLWQNWTKRQSERILDTLDISYLRKLKVDGIDQNFKPRILDLSQNVDREQDRRQPGIFPCILPRGNNFLTTRGGITIGLEALALQGIPVDSLKLTKETNGQLQDLAGNAMSSTVVGVVIISAIIAGRRLLCGPQLHDSMSPSTRLPNSLQIISREQPEGWELQEKHVSKPWNSALDLHAIGIQAAKAVQHCSCEGQTATKNRQFLYCQDCQLRVCVACHGNPRHNYKSLDTSMVQGRMSPMVFENTLRMTVPALINLDLTDHSLALCGIFDLFDRLEKCSTRQAARKMQNDGTVKPKQPAAKNNKGNTTTGKLSTLPRAKSRAWRFALDEALPTTEDYVELFTTTDSHMKLTSIERTRYWSVRYENTKMRLELQIRPRISQSSADSAFDHPTQESTFEWLLFFKTLPREPLGSEVSKFFSVPRARMTPHRNLLEGKWEVFQPCQQLYEVNLKGLGARHDCWERRLGIDTDQKVFSKFQLSFVRDENAPDLEIPHELLQIEGEYAWLTNCGGPNGSLHRKIFHGVKPAPEPVFIFLDPAALTSSEEDYFVAANDHGALNNALEARQIICKFVSPWKASKQFQTRCSPLVDPLSGVSGCDFRSSVAVEGFWKETPSVQLQAVDVKFKRWLHTEESRITVGNRPCRKAENTLMSFETSLGEREERTWSQQHELDLTGNPAELSFLTWQKPDLYEIARGDGWQDVIVNDSLYTNGHIDRCNICALPSKAVKFEDCQNQKGKRTRIVTEAAPNTIDDEYDAKHRPAALSGVALRTGTSGAYVRINGNVQTLYHRACSRIIDLKMLIDGDAVVSSVQWRIAKDDSSRYGLSFEPLILKDNKGDEQAPQPPSLARPLRADQRRSLHWMLDREKPDGVSFENKVIEESCFPALNARLEVKVGIHQPIRGGIVADEVGYGKTAIIFGLVDATWEDFIDHQDCAGLTRTKATLVIVPPIIADQWVSEHRYFHTAVASAGSSQQGRPSRRSRYQGPEIVLIKSTASIKLDQIQNAKIVVVSHSVFGSAYESKLGSSSPNRPGREFDQWLSNMLEKHRLGQDTTIDHAEVQEKDSSSGELDQKGKKRSQAQPATQPNKRRKTVQEDQKSALLHSFHWRRVVIDEFTYLEGKASQLASKLSAEAKWIMSGTPDLTNFASVNEMAGLLGISLGEYDDREGLAKAPGTLERMSQELTFVEQFQLLEEVHSAHWHHSRHQHAQDFLNICARQNKAEIDQIETLHHHRLVFLSPAERFSYSTIVSHLMSRSMTGRKKMKEVKNTGNEMKEHIKALMQSCSVTAEALSRSCSTPPPIAARSCDSILTIKAKEMASTLENVYQQLRYVWHIQLLSGTENFVEQPFVNFLRCISANTYGDEQVMAIVNGLIRLAKENKVMPSETLADTKKKEMKVDKTNKAKSTKRKRKQKPEVSEDASDEDPENFPDGIQADETDDGTEETQITSISQKDLFDRANYVTDQTLDLVDQVRAMRQLLAVHQYSNDSTLLRDCALCHRMEVDASNIVINVACGHLVCDECLPTYVSTESQECGVNGCTAGIRRSCVIPAQQFCHTGAQDEADKCSKFQEICDLITGQSPNKLIQDDDKVIIFVQYDDVTAALEHTLADRGINFKSIGGKSGNDKLSGQDEESLNAFKDPNGGVKVCVLRSDSPSSAGLNLQCANHVMFVSTLLTNSQQVYDATMTQMIGRVKRFQQQKVVHTWSILAAHTIDVNELQERTNAVLVSMGDDDAELELVPYKDASGRIKKVHGWEGEFSGPVVKSDASYMGDLAND